MPSLIYFHYVLILKMAAFDIFLVCLNIKDGRLWCIIRPSRDGAVLCDWVWRVGIHTGFCTITLVLYFRSLPNLATWFIFILGSLGQMSLLLYIDFLTTGSFPHDNFSSVYWIFNKLGHMIVLWKGKNPFYFGVIRSKVKVTLL